VRYRTVVPIALAALMGVLAVGLLSSGTPTPASREVEDSEEVLPSPRLEGPVSLEAAMATRRSVRDLANDPLSRAELGQLLWAAQGITDEEGRRTVPSAGATYPLEVLVATEEGVARYVPAGHRLAWLGATDVRGALRMAALDQAVVGEAPAVIVISGVVERTAPRYGERAERYVTLEAGHAAQNLLLQAAAMGLGAVPVGSFDDAEVHRVLGLATGEAPLYLVPVGHPR